MLNTNLANSQAEDLRSKVNDLNAAKSQLSQYRSIVNNNWKSSEVVYINRSIDAVIGKIDQQIREINSIANDIKTQAAQIRAAQEAEARRQAEIRRRQQAKIQAKNAARNEMNAADTKVKDAQQRLDELSKKLAKKANRANREAYENACKELNECIEIYNKAVDKYNAL